MAAVGQCVALRSSQNHNFGVPLHCTVFVYFQASPCGFLGESEAWGTNVLTIVIIVSPDYK